MRMAIVLLLLLLSPSAVMAATPPTAEPLFSEIHFGDAPKETMLCTAGPCASGQISSGHRKPRQRISVYKMPVTATHVDGVEISTPEYSFHGNRLFRVSFRIICPQDLNELCMARLSEAFNQRYGMTQINQTFDSPSPGQARLQQNYLTKGGYRVELCCFQENGQWQQPFVSIYHPNLMEAVRLAANPKYHSNVN